MSAGLPSTGIGSALYLALIIWMVVRQVGRVAIKTSASSQWPYVGKTTAIAVAMISVGVGESVLIHRAAMPLSADFAILPVVCMALMPFILLLLLMACLHFLRLAVGTAKTKREVCPSNV